MKDPAEEYGGFWSRFSAFCIDVVLCFVIPFTILAWIYGAEWWKGDPEFKWNKWEGAGVFWDGVRLFWRDWVLKNLTIEDTPKFFLGRLFVYYLVPAIYFIGFNTAKSATPGKMALGLKIVDAETGMKPSVRQFIGRHFAAAFSWIPLMLGFFWVAWDRRKQSFHDRLAVTVVVKNKSEEPVV